VSQTAVEDGQAELTIRHTIKVNSRLKINCTIKLLQLRSQNTMEMRSFHKSDTEKHQF